jgi:hypothetical protein
LKVAVTVVYYPAETIPHLFATGLHGLLLLMLFLKKGILPLKMQINIPTQRPPAQK